MLNIFSMCSDRRRPFTTRFINYLKKECIIHISKCNKSFSFSKSDLYQLILLFAMVYDTAVFLYLDKNISIHQIKSILHISQIASEMDPIDLSVFNNEEICPSILSYESP